MQHAVVSREAYLKARADLLAREKALTRAQDALSAEQRALPWVEITTPYVFQGPEGPLTLGELFDGRSQLFVHHFMISSDDTTQCVGCTLEVDHVDGVLEHLWANDITYVLTAPVERAVIDDVRRRMGWSMPWLSTLGSTFTADIRQGFMPPGAPTAFDSVFFKDSDGRIFHTWSTSGRGSEAFVGVYRFIDVTPKGRSGETRGLIDWARPRPDYGKGGSVGNDGRYHPVACACSKHAVEA